MRTRRFLRSDDGTGLVEFALAAIFLFSIIFFIIEFGLAVWRYNTVASLAKDGARWASLHGSESATVADSAAVQNYVNTKTPGIPVVVRTTWPGGNKDPGSVVQVRVDGSFTPLTKIVPQGTRTLRSTAQVVIAH